MLMNEILIAASFMGGFLLGSLLDSEDGIDIFLQDISRF
jgi:hypothetical protein